jgi:hypothetical protein
MMLLIDINISEYHFSRKTDLGDNLQKTFVFSANWLLHFCVLGMSEISIFVCCNVLGDAITF